MDSETFCCNRCFERFPNSENINETYMCIECSKKPKLVRDKLIKSYTFRGHPVEMWSLKEEAT